MKSAGIWLMRFALAGYALVLQLVLAFLHFVAAAPYLSLILLPIPVLAPAALFAERFPGTWRVYLCLQLAGITAQMALRVLLDLWIPVRI